MSASMDPSVAALISALAQSADQARRDQEQARRDHEAAMAQMVQGQGAFLERLGVTMAQQMGAGSSRAHSTGLVDPHGIGKPVTLTGRVANDALGFRAWRIKFRNWIVAGIPEAASLMELLERQNQEEITEAAFLDLELTQPIATRLSAQLGATLVALTDDEPFQIITKGPQGPRGGLEGLRRLYQRYDPTGPRSAKTVLKRIMAVKPVPATRLRLAVEDLENMFEEYRIRAGNPIQDDLKALFLEQLLEGAIATHIDLNSGRLGDYASVRQEIWHYAERVGDASRSGVAPMDIGAVQNPTSRKNPDIECWNCGKKGHRAADCRAKPSNAPGAKPGANPKGGGAARPGPAKAKGKGGPADRPAPKPATLGLVQSSGNPSPEGEESEPWPGDADEETPADLGCLFALEEVPEGEGHNLWARRRHVVQTHPQGPPPLRRDVPLGRI